MKSIRARITILFSVTLSVILAFGFLTYNSYKNYHLLLEEQLLSHQIKSVAAYFMIRSTDEDKKRQLIDFSKNLAPEFRNKAVADFIEGANTEKLLFLNKTEDEFQKYNAPLIDYQKKRIQYFAAITIGFALIFSLIICYAALQIILNPLSGLAKQMYDFLNNRYSYKFSTPEENEIGELHSTFNQLAQKVLSQIDELKALDKAKTEFLSIASHELRTPLTSIKGSLSLMRAGVTGQLSESTVNLMNIALVETERLIRIINELLDLAKIEARQFPLKCEWLSAAELVQKTFAGLQGLSTAAQVALESSGDKEFEIDADSDRLQQVLTNLLSNAIKFSPPHSRVSVRVTKTDENVLRFEVHDQGPGIAPEDQELIFEKFRQATGPKNPLVKGTGLGLTIAKALVEQHGGTIGVDSRPGQGSTFYFTIPNWRLKSSMLSAG